MLLQQIFAAMTLRVYQDLPSRVRGDRGYCKYVGQFTYCIRGLSKIWRSREINQSNKVKVYETLVLSILPYNAETWTLTKELNERIRVF